MSQSSLDHFRELGSSHFPTSTTRREFLMQTGGGFGGLALASLLHEESALASGKSADNPLAPRKPQFPARAKRVIYLFLHGGPSHVDLFDPKPELVKYGGQPLPESFGKVKTRRSVTKNPLMPPARPWPARAPHRSSHRRIAHRPEAPRPARRYAGDSGR